MGKPESAQVPGVSARILALTTPPFTSTQPKLLTPDAKLQAALDRAVAATPSIAAKIPIAIAFLDPVGPARPVAQVRGSEVHFSASLLKVAAMYAAFQLRKTIRDISAEFGTKTTKKELLGDAARYLNPKILAEVAKIPALKGIKRENALPLYTSVFEVKAPAKAGDPFGVDFTSGFAKKMERMISVSDNHGAANTIRGVGYGFLNGTLVEGGFFDPNTNNGIWLAADYEGVYPKFRIDSVNDKLVAQATTVIDLAHLYVLIHDEKVVDPASCKEMLHLLTLAVAETEVFIDRDTKPLHFRVTHNKLGVAPLKVGGDVCSECGILVHDTGAKFVVGWQNYTEADFDSIGRVVRDTLDTFVKKP